MVTDLPQGEVAVPSATPPRLWLALAGLAGLCAAELLLISGFTPHAALRGAPGLAGLVFSLGIWKARVLVTLAIVSVLFWQSRGERNLASISGRLIGIGTDWRWLFIHSASILAFAGLTFVLFQHRPQSIAAADFLVVAWLASGAAAVMAGALTFLPGTFWREVLGGSGDMWAYVLVLGISACALAAYAEPIWSPLARWTLRLAWLILRPIVPGLTANPATMSFGTHRFMVEVGPGCSGYEGIALILMFTTAWLWFFRSEWRFPRALLLIPLGVAAIWIFNAIRIAALVLIGVSGAPDIAIQGFHSHAGWISFNIVALGICLGARRLSWLTTAGHRDGPLNEASEPNPIAPYLLPFLAILASSLVAGAASSQGFEWLYPLRVIAAGGALWYFRNRYRSLDWRVSWPAVALGAIVFCIWLALEPLAGPAHSSEPWQLAHASPLSRLAWLAFRIFGAVITVPVAEELAFRGFLFRRLVSADFESVAWRAFAWMPFLISSVGFGLLHGDRWLAGTLAGMIYALAMLRRGRIGEAVAAHAVTNALLAGYVLATGNWQLW